MKKPIPKAIRQHFLDLEGQGGSIVHLGRYKGADAYVFAFDEDMDTGFPIVATYRNGVVEDVQGFEAVHVCSSFLDKD